MGIGRPISGDELNLHITVFQRARQLTWAGGFLGMMTGFIQMMTSLGFKDNSPEYIFDCLLVGGGVAMLTLFYGVILAEVIITPLKHAMIARFRGTQCTGSPTLAGQAAS